MSDYRISPFPTVHVLPRTGVQIEGDTGPLRAGDLQITGGLSLWITRVELHWRSDYQRSWALEVRVTTKMPDRFNPTMPVDVMFAQTYSIHFDEDGELLGLPRNETRDTWVAYRVHQTLSYVASHEVSESVVHGGKLLVDLHADDAHRGIV